jgi:hypothetical protein
MAYFAPSPEYFTHAAEAASLVDSESARVETTPITEADCTLDGRKNERQWDYVSAASRFNVVVCSRRAGKSEGAVRRAARVLLSTPGARVCYVTLIRRNCRKYFHMPLLNLLRAKHAAVKANEAELTLLLPNGSYAQAFSCSDASDVETVLGDKWDLAIVDEAQSMRDDVISELVDRALLPSLLDRRGSLDLLGTPPPGGEVGYFWRVFSGGEFVRHRWTLFDNPWIPSNEVQELLDARALTTDHAIYKREFLGQFIVDPDSLVFEYAPGRNDLPAELPDPDNREVWRYAMGLDLGFQDRDAISVLGWRKDDPEHHVYDRWRWQKNHQDVDQLAAVFVEAYKRWHPIAIVGDTGGHGAVKVLKSLEARLGGVQMLPKPTNLLDSIGLTNDELRTGRMLVESKGIIAQDFKLTTWKAGKRGQEISEAYHSDILAALRYALHAAQHYRGKAAAPPETLDQKRYRVMQERRKQEMNFYG